jgi:multidrug resistance efflux pump
MNQLSAGILLVVLTISREHGIMRWASWLIVGGAVALLMGGGAMAEQGSGAPEGAAPAPNGPPTQKVEAEPFRIEAQAEGVFEAVRMAPVLVHPEAITPPEVERAVAHGQRVKKGATLIWLDTRKLDEEVRVAEDAVKMSQLALRDGEAELKLLQESESLDLQAARKANERAQDELEYFLAVREPRARKSADVSLRNARFQLEYAQEELNQLEKMYEADDLTEETEEIILKRARRAVESSRHSLGSSEIAHDRTLNRELPREREQLQETAQRAQLAWDQARVKLTNTLPRKQLEVATLRRDHEKAAEKLSKVKRDRAAVQVRSPIDGVVYYGRCVRGAWPDVAKITERLQPHKPVPTDQPVMTVVALRPLQVRLGLAEKELHLVRRGTPASVVPTGLPQLELDARVTQLSLVPITSGVFDCQLQLNDKEVDERLVPGMKCQVKLIAYDKEKTLVVPAGAVFAHALDGDKEHDYVWVVKGEAEYELRRVVVGRRTKEKVEILRGLKAGEEISLEKPAQEPSS